MFPNGFTFGTGDEITISIKVKEKKIVFYLKNDEKKKTELSLESLPYSNFKEFEFCVAFSGIGDKVEIV